MNNCKRCSGCGSAKTYENQVAMPISGKVRCIDWCIHQIVAALNAGGVVTTACCCGHGEQDGRIDLEDGRVLIIKSPAGGEEATELLYPGTKFRPHMKGEPIPPHCLVAKVMVNGYGEEELWDANNELKYYRDNYKERKHGTLIRIERQQ